MVRDSTPWQILLAVALAVFVVLFLGVDGVDNGDDAPEVWFSPVILIVVLVEAGLALLPDVGCKALLLGGSARSPRSPPPGFSPLFAGI